MLNYPFYAFKKFAWTAKKDQTLRSRRIRTGTYSEHGLRRKSTSVASAQPSARPNALRLGRTYKVVAVVIALLRPHPDLDLVVARVARRLEEVLGEELTRLVEVVPSAL